MAVDISATVNLEGTLNVPEASGWPLQTFIRCFVSGNSRDMVVRPIHFSNDPLTGGKHPMHRSVYPKQKICKLTAQIKLLLSMKNVHAEEPRDSFVSTKSPQPIDRPVVNRRRTEPFAKNLSSSSLLLMARMSSRQPLSARRCWQMLATCAIGVH